MAETIDRLADMQTIVDGLPLIVLAIDAEQRLQHLAGRDVLRLEIPRERLVGQPLNAVHKELPLRLSHVQRAQQGGPFAAVVEFHGQSYETHYQPQRDSAGRHTGLLCYAQDVSSRLAMEQTIDEQRTKMVTSSRFSMLGEMSAGIAHEINNPLAVVMSRADQLKNAIERGRSTPEKSLDGLRRITDSATRIARIIKGLRHFARQTEDDPVSTLTLGELVDDTLMFCNERFKVGAIALDIQNEIPQETIQCRHLQIIQVVLNLLNNAYDAVQGLEERWVRLEVQDADDRVQISVIDSGVGIPAPVVKKLFQPFFTTKEVGRGTGLGLSQAQGIVTTHNGSLIYDRGISHTCFRLQLPKRMASQADSAA